jgi:hypothetical protein
MSVLRSIPGGYHFDVGTSDEGWYVVALSRPACDEHLLRRSPPEKYTLAEGVPEADWQKVLDRCLRRKLVVATESEEATIIEAPERIIGPVCPRSATASTLAAWIRKEGDAYHLELFSGRKVRVLLSRERAMRRPSVEMHDGDAYVAYGESTASGDKTVVLDSGGTVVGEADVRNATLYSDGATLWMVGERVDADSSCVVLSRALEGGEPLVASAEDRYVYHGDLLPDPETGRLYLAAEISPRWGHHELIGMYRQLGLWVCEPNGRAFRPAPGTANGVLPVRGRAFADYRRSLMQPQRYVSVPPIVPRLLSTSEGLMVTYRAFRPRGFKSFGWDVLAVRSTEDGWSKPVRLSERIGPPDIPHAFVQTGDSLLLVSQVFEQRATRTFAEEAAGDLTGGGVPRPSRNPEVEIRRIDPNGEAAPYPIPPERLGSYREPPSWSAVAPEPPALAAAGGGSGNHSAGGSDNDSRGSGPSGMNLLWCDFHNHTTYSKCMAAMDGSPQEMVRFQRDVLGCKVITFTDHWHLMSRREMEHHFDVLEAEAGDDCIVLYGCEPGTYPGHHTNFYAVDREIAERLWRIVYRVQSRGEIYRRIRAELPERSVAVLRHFHGGRWTGGDPFSPRVGDDHAPDLEIAAEAMQNRGCSMLKETPNDRGLPAFPVNFLNKGAKLGLVGGSDHNGGLGTNHYCLTGFWVEAPTREAVWDALWDRRTVATQNGKVALWTELSGEPMGRATVGTDNLSIEATVTAARPIRRAALMQDGVMGPWQEVGGTSARLQFRATFYGPSPTWLSVVVEADSAYQDAPILAFSSPHFVRLP